MVAKSVSNKILRALAVAAACLALLVAVGISPGAAYADSVQYVERSWDGSKVVETVRWANCTPITNCDEEIGSGWYFYGAADPELTAVVSNIASGETLDYTLSREEGEDAGAYAINVTPGANPNYAVQGIGAKFSITRNISGAEVTLAKTSYTYNGKAQMPVPTVKLGGKTLKSGLDYTVSYKNNVKAGTATFTVTGKGGYTGSKSATFKIKKASNPAKLTVKTKSVKYASTKKKAQTVCPLTVSKAKGKVTYAKVAKGSSKRLTVNAKTGKVTVKKGTKKGVYAVKIKVRVAGNANYKALTKTVTAKVNVR